MNTRQSRIPVSNNDSTSSIENTLTNIPQIRIYEIPNFNHELNRYHRSASFYSHQNFSENTLVNQADESTNHVDNNYPQFFNTHSSALFFNHNQNENEITNKNKVVDVELEEERLTLDEKRIKNEFITVINAFRKDALLSFEDFLQSKKCPYKEWENYHTYLEKFFLKLKFEQSACINQRMKYVSLVRADTEELIAKSYRKRAKTISLNDLTENEKLIKNQLNEIVDAFAKTNRARFNSFLNSKDCPYESWTNNLLPLNLKLVRFSKRKEQPSRIELRRIETNEIIEVRNLVAHKADKQVKRNYQTSTFKLTNTQQHQSNSQELPGQNALMPLPVESPSYSLLFSRDFSGNLNKNARESHSENNHQNKRSKRF
ncbi:MAG: hypothetical protein JO149_09865 [Gammaproteobacteria bacterium]|nr:hypothetical protein [Gammaproteobacteria bacterium]